MTDNPFAPLDAPPAEVFEDLTMTAYGDIDAVRRTQLWLFATEGAYGYDWWQRRGGKPVGEAADLGRAIHHAILEPNIFRSRYVVWSKRTKAGAMSPRRGKDFDAFEADAQSRGMEILTPALWEQCIEVRNYALRRKGLRHLFREGMVEASIVWTDPETGVPCKARPDFVDRDRRRVIDIKTTYDLDERGDERKAREQGMHLQAAMFEEACARAGIEIDSYWILWLRTKGPPKSRLLQIPEFALQEGREVFRDALPRYARCVETGEWPEDPMAPEVLRWSRSY